MKVIELDATKWTTVSDCLGAILNAIGAPDWHGRNLNALQESIVWGEINELNPPYVIRISGTSGAPDDVRKFIEATKLAIAKARKDYQRRMEDDVEVSIEIDP